MVKKQGSQPGNTKALKHGGASFEVTAHLVKFLGGHDDVADDEPVEVETGQGKLPF